tara:strand:+ start:37 stop:588 length:552 start_codon:yes stop_codon:yes gene_type:complete
MVFLLVPAHNFSNIESEAIDQLLKLAKAVDSSNCTKLTTASPLAQGKKYIAKGQRTTTGYYTTLVRSTLQDLHPFIEAEDNSSKYTENNEEAYNNHHSIRYYAMSLPNPVHDREWFQSVVTKVEAEKVIIVCVPCIVEEKARNVHPDRVRAEIRNMSLLKSPITLPESISTPRLSSEDVSHSG